MNHAYNSTKNACTNCNPYFDMFHRHPRLPIDLAFGLQSSNVAFSKSRYVDRIKKRLEYTYNKVRSFPKKKAQRSKDKYDRKANFVSLEPSDVIQVRKMIHPGNTKFKIGGKMMTI